MSGSAVNSSKLDLIGSKPTQIAPDYFDVMIEHIMGLKEKAISLRLMLVLP
ncbi:MAG: hypothetical protein AB4080_05300 [Trichodesmium sp.]